MISASVKEILLFKAFKFLAIHTDIFNVICGPYEHQFYNEMYHQRYEIKAYDSRNTMVKKNPERYSLNFMLDKSRNKLTLFSFRHHGMMTWIDHNWLGSLLSPRSLTLVSFPGCDVLSSESYTWSRVILPTSRFMVLLPLLRISNCFSDLPYSQTLTMREALTQDHLPYIGKLNLGCSSRMMTKAKQCKFISGFV